MLLMNPAPASTDDYKYLRKTDDATSCRTIEKRLLAIYCGAITLPHSWRNAATTAYG
jgi:hypothetical protein